MKIPTEQEINEVLRNLPRNEREQFEIARVLSESNAAFHWGDMSFKHLIELARGVQIGYLLGTRHECDTWIAAAKLSKI